MAVNVEVVALNETEVEKDIGEEIRNIAVRTLGTITFNGRI